MVTYCNSKSSSAGIATGSRAKQRHRRGCNLHIILPVPNLRLGFGSLRFGIVGERENELVTTRASSLSLCQTFNRRCCRRRHQFQMRPPHVATALRTAMIPSHSPHPWMSERNKGSAERIKGGWILARGWRIAGNFDHKLYMF